MTLSEEERARLIECLCVWSPMKCDEVHRLDVFMNSKILEDYAENIKAYRVAEDKPMFFKQLRIVYFAESKK